MHDLRREAASRAFEKGLGIELVMVLTGHKTPSILLKHYTTLKASEAAAKLGEEARCLTVLDGHDIRIIPLQLPQRLAISRALGKRPSAAAVILA